MIGRDADACLAMVTFYGAVFVLLVVETFATVLFGLSSEVERTIARKQSSWTRESAKAHLTLALRVAFRAALAILIAVRIVQLTE